LIESHRTINSRSTHFVLSEGSGGGYNRSRNDNRGNNDDRGSGGYSRGRSDYNNSSSGGGGGGGGDDSRLETQRDTIFIQNLPRNVTVDQLKDVFSQIGIIKVSVTDIFRL
jgi:RNA recognition motif-containing protein